MKFRVKKVHVFGYKDKEYYPGDIVELTDPKDIAGLSGMDFLERVEEPKPKPIEPPKTISVELGPQDSKDKKTTSEKRPK